MIPTKIVSATYSSICGQIAVYLTKFQLFQTLSAINRDQLNPFKRYGHYGRANAAPCPPLRARSSTIATRPFQR